MDYLQAQLQDARLLASLNQQLIIDEGHRNPMSLTDLEQRMSAWLVDGYSAVIFINGDKPAGYALYRREPDHIYLRQFFVCREVRRRGVGRAALSWLRKNAWTNAPRIRLDVLVGNTGALAFWRSVGFTDYCVTMELAEKSGG